MSGVQLTVFKEVTKFCLLEARQSRFSNCVVGRLKPCVEVGCNRMLEWSDWPKGGRRVTS